MSKVVAISQQLKDSKWKLGTIAVVIVIVGMIIADGLVSVPAGHVGVIFDQGSGVLENELDFFISNQTK